MNLFLARNDFHSWLKIGQLVTLRCRPPSACTVLLLSTPPIRSAVIHISVSRLHMHFLGFQVSVAHAVTQCSSRTAGAMYVHSAYWLLIDVWSRLWSETAFWCICMKRWLWFVLVYTLFVCLFFFSFAEWRHWGKRSANYFTLIVWRGVWTAPRQLSLSVMQCCPLVAGKCVYVCEMCFNISSRILCL